MQLTLETVERYCHLNFALHPLNGRTVDHIHQTLTVLSSQLKSVLSSNYSAQNADELVGTGFALFLILRCSPKLSSSLLNKDKHGERMRFGSQFSNMSHDLFSWSNVSYASLGIKYNTRFFKTNHDQVFAWLFGCGRSQTIPLNISILDRPGK